LLAFSRRFGDLDPPGPNPYGEPFNKQHPEINVISNVVEAGKPIGNLGDGEAVWHADMTYVDVPPKAAMLYSLEVPPSGGNTYFADMFAAYETLPADLEKAAEGKDAVHDASRNSAGMLRKGYRELTDVRETVGARHPLVRTDPQTGRKALFLGRRPNSYVLGLDVAESEALLDALWAHATQPRFAMCHEWKVGDLLMWNNLSVLQARPVRPELAPGHAPHPNQGERTDRLKRKTRAQVEYPRGSEALLLDLARESPPGTKPLPPDPGLRAGHAPEHRFELVRIDAIGSHERPYDGVR
jgi:taurine dioxygenase